MLLQHAHECKSPTQHTVTYNQVNVMNIEYCKKSIREWKPKDFYNPLNLKLFLISHNEYNVICCADQSCAVHLRRGLDKQYYNSVLHNISLHYAISVVH